MCGEAGTARNGTVHHYYKCVSVKKKRNNCHKKSVRKQWIEDVVVKETMRVISDDKMLEAIVSMVLDLQDRENSNLPLYEQQLNEANIAINNMLNAIQQGVLTKSTKSRLEELEANKEEIEKRIAQEKISNPKVTADFVRFWLEQFRSLNITKKEHKKILIDTFINTIYLFDDKLIIGFNYKEQTRNLRFDDLKTVNEKSSPFGSDLDCSSAPYREFITDSYELSIFLLL